MGIGGTTGAFLGGPLGASIGASLGKNDTMVLSLFWVVVSP